MSDRDAILAAIRGQRVRNASRPPAFRPPTLDDDPIAMFGAHATRAAAEVRQLGTMRELPQAIADALRSRNMGAVIHLPEKSPLQQLLPWHLIPQLDRVSAAPGPNEAAVSLADFGIAETGTLVYASRQNAPASWHFRPGLEIAIVRTRTILPNLEAIVARLRAAQECHATVNLVTGPSRTGDIEQTLELGAHGPKDLVVLIVGE